MLHFRSNDDHFCSAPYNFPFVGLTQHDLQSSTATTDRLRDYDINFSRIYLGQGRNTFQRAQSLLFNWNHFNFNWAFTNTPAIKPENTVLVIAQSVLLWTINPLRITFIERNQRPSNKKERENGVHRHSTFAHTTVQGHQIAGEERFSIEWRKVDDSVWYSVYTISKPATLIAYLAQPVLRYYQRKFVKESQRKMAHDVITSQEHKM